MDMDLHRSGEDYLETILILRRKNGTVRSRDVVKYLEVTRPSVSRAIQLLKEGGFLEMKEDKSLVLTEIGEQTAKRVYEKHCVLTEALVSIGVDPETAENDACLMEHIISRETFDKIKQFVDHRTRSAAQTNARSAQEPSGVSAQTSK